MMEIHTTARTFLDAPQKLGLQVNLAESVFNLFLLPHLKNKHTNVSQAQKAQLHLLMSAAFRTLDEQGTNPSTFTATTPDLFDKAPSTMPVDMKAYLEHKEEDGLDYFLLSIMVVDEDPTAQGFFRMCGGCYM